MKLPIKNSLSKESITIFLEKAKDKINSDKLFSGLKELSNIENLKNLLESKKPEKPLFAKDKKIKIYRFALYGATGSGKTVLLAALADHRKMYVSDYSCNAVALPPSPDNLNARQAKRYLALQEGKKWLDRSIGALRSGNLPAPTPSDHPDILFEYEFSDGHRIYRIELLDYSGESIDPTLSDTERATRLRNQLKERDGLLVLAPAPSEQELKNHIENADTLNIRSLRESFSLLHSERQKDALSIPVAMIVTKWDRFSNFGEDVDPTKEELKLREFLKQESAHRDLFMALRSIVEDPDRDFNFFPVSALGPCDETGRPKRFAPLYSYGLEEPFIWAARRHDEIEFSRYQFEVAKSNLDKNWAQWLPWPFGLRPALKAGDRIVQLLPPIDPVYKKAEHQQVWLKQCYRKRWISFVAALTFLYITVEGLFDYINYQNIIQIINDPKSSPESVQYAENWLAGYQRSVFPLHLLARISFLSHKKAVEQLENLRAEREETYWSFVRNASPEDKEDMIKEYLRIFPNGRYTNQAMEMLGEKNWREFERIYNAALRDGKTVEASEYLKTRELDPRAQELIRNFEQSALSILSDFIKKSLASENYDEAYDYFNQIRGWPLNWRTQKGIEDERKLKNNIDESYDRFLYEQARTYRSSSALDNYIINAPLGSMKREVQFYKDWLERQDDPMNLSIVISRVEWDENIGNEDGIEVTVWVNDDKALQISGLKSRSGKIDSINSDSYQISARLRDKIKIRVAIADTDGWLGIKEMGMAEKNTLVRDLNYLRIPVSYEKITNVVILGLRGIQNEPILPAWRKE